MLPLLSFAIELASQAGVLLMDYFEGEFEVETKSSVIDLVTSADRAAEALIIAAIRDRYPDHAILAEESGAITGHAISPLRKPAQTSDTAAKSPLRWIIDPLDGTTNFAHSLPHFCVSIAAWDQDGGRIGVIHDPVRNETFFARRGGGAFLESARGPHRRLAIRQTTELQRALVATGFSYKKATEDGRSLREFSALVPQLRGIRRAGSAALDLAYVAAGRLDGYWERSLSPWDTAAGALLVQESGGSVRTIGGGDWHPERASILAASPSLLPTLTSALQRGGDNNAPPPR